MVYHSGDRNCFNAIGQPLFRVTILFLTLTKRPAYELGIINETLFNAESYSLLHIWPVGQEGVPLQVIR